MKNIWDFTGRMAFWALWPGFWLYLWRSERTRLLLIHDDKVLVTRNWVGNGKWSLPGGGLHDGEDRVSGLLREVREEVGVTLDAKQVAYVGTRSYEQHGFWYRYHVYVAYVTQTPKLTLQQPEIAEAAWADYRKLPTDPKADQDVRDAIEAWSDKMSLLQ